MEESTNGKECFVIMPISDPEGYESGHFKRVYKDIFIPAIQSAGFTPYRADDNNSASLIQLNIIRKLIESPMAICDLSSRNPNVLFELGIRQAFDKPVVLIQEYGTPRIFDISSINTIDYKKELIYHEVLEDQRIIGEAIRDTFADSGNGNSINSIINLLSINPAKEKISNHKFKEDPRMQLIMVELANIRTEIEKNSNKKNENDTNEIINRRVMFANSQYSIFSKRLKNIEVNGVIDYSLQNDIKECINYCKDMYNEYRTLEFIDIRNKLIILSKKLRVQESNNNIDECIKKDESM